MDEIYTDLTARRGGAGIDLTKARRLARNAGVAFMGDTKGGPFDVAGDLAREWLREPTNPNGRPNSDVLAPWMNGMAITRRPADKWIVDFGLTMVKEEAALYEAPFQHAQQHVRTNMRKEQSGSRRAPKSMVVATIRATRPKMRERSRRAGAVYRYAYASAKHRLFAWLDARSLPRSAQLIVIARDDDTTFGVLHSRFHEVWALRKGNLASERAPIPATPPPRPSRPSPFQKDSSPERRPRRTISRIHERRPSLRRCGGSSHSATTGSTRPSW